MGKPHHTRAPTPPDRTRPVMPFTTENTESTEEDKRDELNRPESPHTEAPRLSRCGLPLPLPLGEGRGEGSVPCLVPAPSLPSSALVPLEPSAARLQCCLRLSSSHLGGTGLRPVSSASPPPSSGAGFQPASFAFHSLMHLPPFARTTTPPRRTKSRLPQHFCYPRSPLALRAFTLAHIPSMRAQTGARPPYTEAHTSAQHRLRPVVRNQTPSHHRQRPGCAPARPRRPHHERRLDPHPRRHRSAPLRAPHPCRSNAHGQRGGLPRRHPRPHGRTRRTIRSEPPSGWHGRNTQCFARVLRQ